MQSSVCTVLQYHELCALTTSQYRVLCVVLGESSNEIKHDWSSDIVNAVPSTKILEQTILYQKKVITKDGNTPTQPFTHSLHPQ